MIGIDPTSALKSQLSRQVTHWSNATSRLKNLDDLASLAAWEGLERYMGVSLREHLAVILDRLTRQAALLRSMLAAASTPTELADVRRRLLAFRRLYLRIETTLDFYGDAINTRTNPTQAALLRACDTLAHRSMSQVLEPLGKTFPVVLTYIDKGLGASILKAGLRLWDGTGENPVAAIKITRHNLHRPTALIHEAGHQVAHIVGWNQEQAAVLASGLSGAPSGVADAWAGWASEITADAFAFVHTGFAAVAALHDVVAGEEAMVLRYLPGDPHPIGYLRVLLGVEMCRQFYGTGPWDELAAAWTQQYPLEDSTADVGALIRASLPFLPAIVELVLRQPMQAFAGKPLTALTDPARVSPGTLAALEQRLGIALYTSMHWIWTEALRLLALAGLRVATPLRRSVDIVKLQDQWMLRLGGGLLPA